MSAWYVVCVACVATTAFQLSCVWLSCGLCYGTFPQKQVESYSHVCAVFSTNRYDPALADSSGCNAYHRHAAGWCNYGSKQVRPHDVQCTALHSPVDY